MYDILLGVNAGTLCGLLRALFDKPNIRKTLFAGRADFGGVEICWSIPRAPFVLLEEPPPDLWESALGPDGGPLPPADNAFRVCIDHLSLTPLACDFAPEVICRAHMAENRLQIEALGVRADLSALSEFDRTAFRRLLIPALLRNFSALLSGGYIPPLRCEGLRFGETQLALKNGMLCFFASLEGRGLPRLDENVPDQPVLLRLSTEALELLARRLLGELSGREIQATGKKNFGIGKTKYSCGVRICGVRAKVGPDPARLEAEVQAVPRAGVYVRMLLVPLEIGYTGSMSPDWIPLRLGLFFEEATLRARVESVGGFRIVLEPSGSVYGKILSGVAWPLAQIMASALTSSFKKLLTGQRFSLSCIGTQSFSVCGETIALIPRGLALRGIDWFLEITGRLETGGDTICHR